jgi:hypothetical protein
VDADAGLGIGTGQTVLLQAQYGRNPDIGHGLRCSRSVFELIRAKAGNTKGLAFNFNSSSLSVNDQGSLMVGKPPWGVTEVARIVSAHVKASTRRALADLPAFSRRRRNGHGRS